MWFPYILLWLLCKLMFSIITLLIQSYIVEIFTKCGKFFFICPNFCDVVHWLFMSSYWESYYKKSIKKQLSGPWTDFNCPWVISEIFYYQLCINSLRTTNSLCTRNQMAAGNLSKVMIIEAYFDILTTILSRMPKDTLCGCYSALLFKYSW